MTRDEWKKTPVAEQDNARLWKPNHSFLIDQWGVSASEMVGLGGDWLSILGGVVDWIVDSDKSRTASRSSPHPSPLPEGEGAYGVVDSRYIDLNHRGELRF